MNCDEEKREEKVDIGGSPFIEYSLFFLFLLFFLYAVEEGRDASADASDGSADPCAHPGAYKRTDGCSGHCRPTDNFHLGAVCRRLCHLNEFVGFFLFVIHI